MRLILLLLCGTALASSAYEPAATGRWAVSTITGEWRDVARDRELPYRIYQPEDHAGPMPLLVMSHGLGGTRDGYAYLGRAWTASGYLVLHLQHHGSDDAVWRGEDRPVEALRRAVDDYQTALDRAKDVTFALGSALRDPALAPLIDTNRMGIAGHSFGAWTVLAAAGQQLGPLGDRLADRRLRAGLAMSPPAPRRVTDETFRGIRMPILHMTGTEDVSLINDTTAAQRRVPFDGVATTNQYLLTFQGGDHLVFSGRGRRASAPRDAEFQALIVRTSLAFWDAFLRDEPAARAWLDEGGCAQALGAAAAWETK